MYTRTWKFAVPVALLGVFGCSREAPAPTTPAAPSALDAVEAASHLKDACPLLPAEVTAQLVPDAAAPQREQFPLRCVVGNGKSALGLTFDNGPADAVRGAEAIPTLAGGGYLERLDPNSPGDVYLTVVLGSNANGINQNFHVEVAAHDGKDHKADAIAIAQSVLQQLK